MTARLDQALSKWLSAVALAVLAGVMALSAWRLASNVVGLDTWLDEGNYLAKGWWFVTGGLQPYSDTEPTLYTPLYFYLMGGLQKLFGIGHAPGRWFSALCALSALWLTYSITRRLTGSVVAGASALVLLAGQYAPLIYYATASPYAVVALLSLLIVRLLISESINRTFVWLLAGVLFWGLFFTRPNMLAFGIFLALWLLAFEPPGRRFVRAASAAAGFLVPAALTIALFGYGLFETVMRTPGLIWIAEVLGLFRTDFSNIIALTTSPLDPQGQWGEIGRTTWYYFLLPFGLLNAVVMLAVIMRLRCAWVRSSSFSLAPIDVFLLYYLGAAAVHLVLSQSYCVPCIMPYANYFLPFGAVAGGLLVAEISAPSGAGMRHAAAALGLLTLGGIISQGLNANSPLLRPTNAPPSPEIARQLAGEIKAFVPQGARVLVLSVTPVVAQAVWLSGGIVEPLTMNLVVSYREFRDDVPSQVREAAQPMLRRSGFWNAQLMRRLLAEDYDFAVISRHANYAEPLVRVVSRGLPFGDILSDYFERTGTARAGPYLIEIMTRRQW